MAVHPSSAWARPIGSAPAVGLLVRRWGAGLVALMLDWVERVRQRRQLGTLNDRLLRDMGVTRRQVERELAKPFWRP